MFRSRVSRLVRSFSSAAAAAPAFTRFASSLGTATRVAAGGAVLTAALLSFSPLETAGAKVDYTAVRKAIADILDDENFDDGSLGPVFVRLAWHQAGSYDLATGTGGSNGCTIRFNPEAGYGANAGLGIARARLEEVKKKFPEISYADLYTLASVVAIEEMGGPKVSWRPGRTDSKEADGCPPDGRLPDASQGADHIRNVFYAKGFNDQEIVALVGCHAIGRMHLDRSGFNGIWTHAPTTFSNQFFVDLLNETWSPVRNLKGNMQYENGKGLTMLPADIAVRKDPEFRKWAELYAKDSDKFFSDFAIAYSKLLELGVPFEDKGLLSWAKCCC